MVARYANGNVIAVCPVCGVQSTFESKMQGSTEHGSLVMESPRRKGMTEIIDDARIVFRLLRCSGCGRAGLAGVHGNSSVNDGDLVEFFPQSVTMLSVPDGIPEGIIKEFREAEKDAAISSYRSASAMLRSVLEKTLTANGYTNDALKTASKKANLYNRIELASEDGILTDSRRRRAHSEVRVLGNDVLHENWKEVKAEDYELAHNYTQRILEDFYDSRSEVLTTLKNKGRVVVEEKESGETDNTTSKQDMPKNA